jgi:cytosine/adenosine deaminase-related metal-dependent hydrolase
VSRLLVLVATLASGAVLGPGEATAQGNFGDLADGPYDRLVILGAMVIPGHGGPPVGPYDIVIEGNRITDMTIFDPVTVGRRGDTERATGDRVIDAEGMYVMPGIIDLHIHLRQLPMELEYVYYLKMAHGVTTMVPAADRGIEQAVQEAQRSAANEILAPRMFPIFDWGENTGYDREFLENPANAQTIAAEMAAAGAHVVTVGPLGWNPELLAAVCKAVYDAGGITTYHIPPSTTPVTNAVDAARAGVTMIEHHYAYAESSLDRTVQDYARDYNYNDENARFRHAGKVWTEANKDRLLNEVVDALVESGVHMLPTRVTYEANRDWLRKISRPWHEKYTHQALIDWSVPNPNLHAVFHYDWTSDDEYYWYYAFDLWGDLIFEFNKRGGHVSYGTDDNYTWGTPGFSNVRELQLLRETGMHTLEVLRAATHYSAQTLRQERFGLVRPGYMADLLVVDGNPAYNLRFLYSFGALTLDDNGQMYRTKGIVHTIKDGIVINNDKLMEEVARMTKESKKGVNPVNAVNEPFIVK